MKDSLTRSLIELVDSLSFPETCQICVRNHACNADGFVCNPCKKNVQRIDRPWCNFCGQPLISPSSNPDACSNCINRKYKFSKARSIFTAKKLPREVIYRLKYNQHVFFEPLLKDWLQISLQLDLNLKPLAIIPIPLHATKERERGFNQASTIGHILSSLIDIPIKHNLLKRVAATESQTHLSRAKRISNVENAFACPEPLSKGGFLLVDDVMTTGATVDSCAKTLLANGASSIEALTITRQIPN